MSDISERPIRGARLNPDGTIDLEVNHPEFGWIPFTAAPTDVEPHGRVLYARAVQGEAGAITEYAPPDAELAAQVRVERDQRLAQTDWTQLPDVPQATRERWAEYRQALRDITLQDGFPAAVQWPEPPN